MSWKEFLKPSWGKVTLAIILFLFCIGASGVVEVLFFFRPGGTHKISFPILCPPVIWEVYEKTPNGSYFLGYHFGFSCTHAHGPGGPHCSLNSFNILIAIPYWYLLSSLMIWIYGKVRKRW